MWRAGEGLTGYKCPRHGLKSSVREKKNVPGTHEGGHVSHHSPRDTVVVMRGGGTRRCGEGHFTTARSMQNDVGVVMARFAVVDIQSNDLFCTALRRLWRKSSIRTGNRIRLCFGGIECEGGGRVDGRIQFQNSPEVTGPGKPGRVPFSVIMSFLATRSNSTIPGGGARFITFVVSESSARRISQNRGEFWRELCTFEGEHRTGPQWPTASLRCRLRFQGGLPSCWVPRSLAVCWDPRWSAPALVSRYDRLSRSNIDSLCSF